MKNGVRPAKRILYFVCGVGIAMSFLYLLTPNLLPFHLNYLGQAQAELEPRTVKLLLYAFRIIGGCFLAIHLSVIFLISRTPKFSDRVRWTVLTLLAVPYLPTLLVALQIGGPWWLFSLGIVAAVCSFFLSNGSAIQEKRS